MINDENSIKKGVQYKKITQNLIKQGYQEWKTPTEIARHLHLLPLEVHNYIQSMQKEWTDLPMACKSCNVKPEKHKRCSSCESGVHLEEEMIHQRRKDWYRMYHEIDGKIFCNWCVVRLAKEHIRSNEEN